MRTWRVALTQQKKKEKRFRSPLVSFYCFYIVQVICCNFFSLFFFSKTWDVRHTWRESCWCGGGLNGTSVKPSMQMADCRLCPPFISLLCFSLVLSFYAKVKLSLLQQLKCFEQHRKCSSTHQFSAFLLFLSANLTSHFTHPSGVAGVCVGEALKKRITRSWFCASPQSHS